MEDRCPLCLIIKKYNLEEKKYLKFQNTEKLICDQCAEEIKGHMRPTWKIMAGRVFPQSTRYI
jgi:superfamily II helicase